MTAVGFYGKIASRGDFVGRGLPASFQQPWDAWLAAGLQACQRQLGEAWLQAYLVSPLWRFVLAPGVCGGAAAAGVLMPSIDRVGRYFPLTVAIVLPAHQSLSATQAADGWFDAVETALLATLEEGARFEDFEAAVQALPDLPQQPAAACGSLPAAQRMAALDAPARLAALAERACDGASLWWGNGSEQVAPGLLRCDGLPAAERFAALLLGREASC
ncbi:MULTISPECIES: type VI secretion system-associated protein TagF [unclassified Pseudomonas]|uniref:type VI secretion system-associated protein TagF n=1 Tax=unclassified Pseudomonas TaxID=196821 RepID=UPI001EFB1846|nr:MULTISPECIES: type VI secretion system-associated protein TagF [unclassified Pseudomonas]MCG8907810.1 type VI secretion system-associated protein TagF [Pseudomonas sp. DP-17]MDU4252402.1 type VI secretion system-associated protein TagF [Pseudomonas sp.]